jgi:DNA-binding transcriptional ArsR family regulator
MAMPFDLEPESRVVLEAVIASLAEGRSDVSVSEIAARLQGDLPEAEARLDALKQAGVLERVDEGPLFAGVDLPPLYSISDRIEREPAYAGVNGASFPQSRPRLSSLEDFHSFTPVESFGWPLWVQELGL